MNNLTEFIESFWLANDPADNRNLGALQKLSGEYATNIYIGYNELGNRCLFLMTDTGHIPSVQNEKTNISLIVNKPNSLIYIELNDLYFGEIFNDLIVSIFNKLKNIPEEQNLNHFISLYKKWNELFKARTERSSLSEKELLGLLGELKYLETRIEKAENDFEVNSVLDAWSGPDGRANDFIFPEISYEVKTIEAQKDFVDISSEYQLSCINRPVELIVYKATVSENGFSLVDIVASVRQKIDEKLGDSEKFLYKLNMFSIDFKNTAVYEDFKILLSEPLFYNCNTEDFPKITAENLISGVFAVKYRLNLNSILKFKI